MKSDSMLFEYVLRVGLLAAEAALDCHVENIQSVRKEEATSFQHVDAQKSMRHIWTRRFQVQNRLGKD